jgi:hypothetical protein
MVCSLLNTNMWPTLSMLCYLGSNFGHMNVLIKVAYNFFLGGEWGLYFLRQCPFSYFKAIIRYCSYGGAMACISFIFI